MFDYKRNIHKNPYLGKSIFSLSILHTNGTHIGDGRLTISPLIATQNCMPKNREFRWKIQHLSDKYFHSAHFFVHPHTFRATHEYSSTFFCNFTVSWKSLSFLRSGLHFFSPFFYIKRKHCIFPVMYLLKISLKIKTQRTLKRAFLSFLLG